MRHRVAGRGLGRKPSHRRALLRGLVTALLKHERIETTLAKAKSIGPIADQIISLGKDGTLHARRKALAFVTEKDIVAKLFSDIAPRYRNRAGGYTRIVKTRSRRGDGAHMALIELTELGEALKKPPADKLEKSQAATPAGAGQA